eukprot:5300821-Prymnesium_polylepis.1
MQSEAALDAFVEAQALEEAGQPELAAAAYHDLCDEFGAAGLAPFDCTAVPAREPPLPLIVSMASNCLGGFYLDARRVPEARETFSRALALWPRNGMSL